MLVGNNTSILRIGFRYGCEPYRELANLLLVPRKQSEEGFWAHTSVRIASKSRAGAGDSAG